MTGVSRAWLNEHFSSAALAGSESVGAERAYLQAGTAGEEAFSAVFESSGEALVLTDSSGVIHQANRRAQYLLGVPESAVHGVNLGTLLAKESGSEVLSLYASAKASKLARIGVMLATGRPLGISARAILPGSSALLLCLEEALAPPCAANKWWQVSPELRSVFDSVLTGIIVFDAAGCVRFSNAAINEIFGLSAPSLRQAKTAEELRDVLAER